MQFNEHTLSIPTSQGAEEIAVLQRSAGDELFVAWHGITAVNRFWFWDILWPHGAVWMAGLPGHGPLRRRPAGQFCGWTPEHLIEAGLGTLRALGDGRPATLIGHSTGGMIALGIVQRAPELVRRLILLAPVVWSDLSGVVGLWLRCAGHPRLLQAVIGASLGAGRLSYQAFRLSLLAFIADRRGFYANPHTDLALRAGYAAMRRTQLAAIAGTVRALRQADLRPQVERAPTAVPTLIIHGERDPIIPIAQSRWLAAALPQAELVALPGTGHVPYGEREAATNQAIQGWLDRHPA
jgi:pimeloyl-ACP methyl ester carboxylesterase